MTRTILALGVIVALVVVGVRPAEAGCDTSQKYDSTTWQSCNSDTSYACAYSSGCYGRCGPACGWSWLGNYYTSACQTHDWCVRDQLCKGASTYNAHYNCRGSLVNAAKSWYSNAWHTAYGRLRDKVSGLIKQIF